MTPIALSITGSASGIPYQTRLRLNGQRMETITPTSEVSPVPARTHSIVLSNKSLNRLRQHEHTGDWILTAAHGTVILVKPHLPHRNIFPYPDTMPVPPGVVMQRPNWTTFTREYTIDYYDGPRAILKEDRNGQTYLALWREDADQLSRWLHIPLSPEALRATLTGVLTLHSAIHQADFIFFADEEPDGAFRKTVMTVPDLIPPAHPILELLPLPRIPRPARRRMARRTHPSTEPRGLKVTTPSTCGACRHWQPTLLSDHEIQGPAHGYGQCNRIIPVTDAQSAPALLYAGSSFDQMTGVVTDGDAALLTHHTFGCTLFETA